MRKFIKRTITGMTFGNYQAGDIPRLEMHTSLFNKLYHKFEPASGFILDEAFVTYSMPDNFLKSALLNTPYANVPIEEVPMEEGVPTNHFRDIIRLQKHQKSVYLKICADKPQIFLNIPTATGKTVLAVHRITQLQTKTIIICYKKKILYQWYDTFKEKTNIDINRVLVVENSQYFADIIRGDKDPNDVDVWLVTPNMISSFCAHNGWEVLPDLFTFMGIGFKIFDEAHRCFGATIKINAYTSIRTLYLSADYMQSNHELRSMFFEALRDADLIRYDQETMDDLKHITCVQYYYKSLPTLEDTAVITNMAKKNKYHWDHYNFTKYQLRNGVIYEHILRILDGIITNEENIAKPAKILILTNMIDSVDHIYTLLNEKITKRSISRYHTRIEKSELDKYLKADIIVSTYQAFAEGVDITTPKIKHVLSLNPVDPVLANQAAGRCRPIEGEDSFYWMLIDADFSYCLNNALKVAQYLSHSKIGKITRIDA